MEELVDAKPLTPNEPYEVWVSAKEGVGMTRFATIVCVQSDGLLRCPDGVETHLAE
jgi:hypothetical protein